MVRNLMMILGLSLAVAAVGCGEDAKPANGGGGSGGSAGPAIPPACNNADDLAGIEAGEPQTELSTACGTAAFADPTFCDPDATVMNACYQDGNMMVNGTTLSEECSFCYAELTCCTLAKCSPLAEPAGPCVGPPVPGDECDQCLQAECQPAFEACGEGAGGSGGNGGNGGSGGAGGSGGQAG